MSQAGSEFDTPRSENNSNFSTNPQEKAVIEEFNTPRSENDSNFSTNAQEKAVIEEFNTPRSENNIDFITNAQEKAATRGGQRGARYLSVSFTKCDRLLRLRVSQCSDGKLNSFCKLGIRIPVYSPSGPSSLQNELEFTVRTPERSATGEHSTYGTRAATDRGALAPGQAGLEATSVYARWALGMALHREGCGAGDRTGTVVRNGAD
jgi:hypothetical protein